MPINVIGHTDTTGSSSVMPGRAKSVCIICKKGEDGTGTPMKLLPVFSTSDAKTKIGNNEIAHKMIKALINKRVPQIFIMIPNMKEVGEEEVVEVVDYEGALNELISYDVSIVLVDDLSGADPKLVIDYLKLAEDEDKYRYSVLSSSFTSVEDLVEFQKTINYDRIFIPGPMLTDQDGKVVEPEVTCAGLAAIISTETTDPALPMNGVEFKGFGGVEKILLKSELEFMVDNGITPIYSEVVGGAPTVYRLVTSHTKTGTEPDKTWQEGTTRFIADDVLHSVRTRILSKYKRTKNVARILDAMKTDVIDVLSTKQELEIIENLDTSIVSVIKDPNDLYGALIDYEFDVVTPLYTVRITQHMKL